MLAQMFKTIACSYKNLPFQKNNFAYQYLNRLHQSLRISLRHDYVICDVTTHFSASQKVSQFFHNRVFILKTVGPTTFKQEPFFFLLFFVLFFF